jgi:hypothetical protein
VDDRSRVLLATIIGAAAGGLLGYLYLTEQGRHVRRQIDPWLDDVMDELQRMRGTVDKAREATAEGRRAFADVFGPSFSRARAAQSDNLEPTPHANA